MIPKVVALFVLATAANAGIHGGGGISATNSHNIALGATAVITKGGNGGHSGGHGGHSGHGGQSGHGISVDYFAPAQYDFKYKVNDPQTGDQKTQTEQRQGDVVKGQYTVADPDGTLRVVDYMADPQNGFNAIVNRQGKATHPITIPGTVINPTKGWQAGGQQPWAGQQQQGWAVESNPWAGQDSGASNPWAGQGSGASNPWAQGSGSSNPWAQGSAGANPWAAAQANPWAQGSAGGNPWAAGQSNPWANAQKSAGWD